MSISLASVLLISLAVVGIIFLLKKRPKHSEAIEMKMCDLSTEKNSFDHGGEYHYDQRGEEYYDQGREEYEYDQGGSNYMKRMN